MGGAAVGQASCLPSEAASEVEINPYTSPAEAGGYDRQPFGVGVWRDGPLLVMHQRVELPRFCIHTGEPAIGGREYVLAWRPPGGIFTTSRPIFIPLCRACAGQFQRLRLQVFASVALASASAGLMFVGGALGDWPIAFFLVGLGLVGFAILYFLYALGINSRELIVVHSHGEYLWVREAHPEFLSRLPPWPPTAS